MKKIYYVIALLVGLGITAFTMSDNKRGSHEIDPKVKAEVFKVLDEYMSTFNAKDLKGWESTYQFPHFRLASGI